jgi:hypothetical protein
MEEKSEVPGEKHQPAIGGFLLVLLIPLPLKLMAGWWFSPGTSDFSSIKTDGWMVVFS